MGYVPQPSSLLLFILETGSYDVARAGLEPCLLLLSLQDFEAYNTRSSQEETVLPFVLQMGTEETKGESFVSGHEGVSSGSHGKLGVMLGDNDGTPRSERRTHRNTCV